MLIEGDGGEGEGRSIKGTSANFNMSFLKIIWSKYDKIKDVYWRSLSNFFNKIHIYF